ncbi:MAG: N-acetylmuramic acid 6-phosphate etherase [Terriglobia bacterium]
MKDHLLTEERNSNSLEIDLQPTEEVLRIINREDQTLGLIVSREIPHIAKAVDLVVQSLQAGGRLFYVGAGTSGRLGVLDASECPPTFNVSPLQIQGIIAGGAKALSKAMEESEDNEEAGAATLKRRKLSAKDIVIGVAASGNTPFTLGAMSYARSVGSNVISITSNPRSKMAKIAAVSIAPIVGPEILTGSTRMKAGTAQKMILNMISTTAMIRLGYVYSNLMINVRMHNEKLRDRGRKIIMAATGVDDTRARRVLKESKGNLKLAVIMAKCGLSRAESMKRLKAAHFDLRVALGERRNLK